MTNKILVAVDLEDEALMGRILQAARELADLHDAQITLVHVAPNMPADVRAHLPDDYEAKITTEVAGKLDELVEKLDMPSGKLHAAFRIGTIYRKIVDEANDTNSDLIVIGCHRPDVADYLLGSNAARVVRHASCSVYVVR